MNPLSMEERKALQRVVQRLTQDQAPTATLLARLLREHEELVRVHSSAKPGRWTRTPPQGEHIVAFLQDPKGVAGFVQEHASTSNLGKTAWLNPQIGVRMIDPELGPIWVVLGEGTWTEEHLKAKGVAWWSKPFNTPMIQIVFPKNLPAYGPDDVFDSLSQDLGREDRAARKPDPRQEGRPDEPSGA
jgi:hypothetical protein